ncbi:hypothetical protein E1263_00560 [Kribbella antibiotica]|uniref:Uncharacterized protein n=1 Tax=Kribbella antibiotica TaxID=190195 RepID=A0A4R4ZYN1_9ACTN|nr:hypothetical protein E1263_00560 [Kribbella antibiotica]
MEKDSVENAKPLVQQTCAAVASQQWVLRPALNLQQLDNRYAISAIKGGKYFDVENCVMDEGANLRTWDHARSGASTVRDVPSGPSQRSRGR